MANDKPTDKSDPKAATAASSTPRLGGGRADFVASLGRKIADLRAVLALLETNPDSPMARDELRRKLHALGAAAKMLHFDGMARCIVETESVLDRASDEGVTRAADVERVARALDELPSLAWGDERPSEINPTTQSPEPPSVKTLTPDTISVLVVGPEDLAEMLVEDIGGDEAVFDCERVEDLAKARSVAHAFAPDVVVLDGDIPGTLEFAQQLMDDPMTDSLPVIVALTPARGDGATRFTALGVMKILPRPLLAGTVRSACQEVVDQRDGKTIKMTLGEPTIAQLGERLALEIRHAIVDAVDENARGTKVSLGDGTEVWGALWGAIARVREVVTASTGGKVQFSGHGPEGALALAPMLTRAGGIAASERAEGGGRSREEAMDVSLTGRRVIVADDDPGVTWFIADLLRTAGCVVHEALDGRTALRMAYEISPELVVSDILMPGLDGFALCRALRRDVALRDTPVILLSWKEDLLQRVRELGASAAAYLRKESDARAILARVREVMRPRARIAARLRGQGEVRGRLDGLTVRSLLSLVVEARPAARVSVRDASFLYEVELRGGGIRRASRTSGDGTFLRGDHVIPAMLGVGAGRFVVTSTKVVPGDESTVPLAEQFAKPIALARSALHATTGARMMTVAKVVLDDEDVAGYLLATPEPARDLVRRLASGVSPREILLHSDVSPALCEDVLADLATRGAIIAVYRADGTDAVRGEAFDAKAVLPDLEGGRASLAYPLPGSIVPPRVPASVRPPATGKDGAANSGPESASPEGALVHAMGSSETPPTAAAHASAEGSAPLAGTKDLSIPMVVEPTDDLRPNLTARESVVLASRPRPTKPAVPAVVEEPSGFPRPLAIGLGVLLVVVLALGGRFWMSQHAGDTQPGAPPAPVNLDTK